MSQGEFNDTRIELFFLYLLLACLYFIWKVIWINEGYRRRERETAKDSLQER